METKLGALRDTLYLFQVPLQHLSQSLPDLPHPFLLLSDVPLCHQELHAGRLLRVQVHPGVLLDLILRWYNRNKENQ